MKILSIALLTLMFIGCTEKEIVYVDANGTPIEHPKPRLEHFKQNVVCNEFGLAYYENHPQGGYVFTPVLRDSGSIDGYGAIVTCEEYEKGKYR